MGIFKYKKRNEFGWFSVISAGPKSSSGTTFKIQLGTKLRFGEGKSK